MPIVATSGWVMVNNRRTRLESQSSTNLLRHVSPEELRQQQALLDGFERDKRKEGEDKLGALQSELAPPSWRRHRLTKSPSAVFSGVSRHLTVSSTAATVGDGDEDVPFPSKHSPLTPTSPDQRKYTQSGTSPIELPRRHNRRAQTEPTQLRTSKTVPNLHAAGPAPRSSPQNIPLPAPRSRSSPQAPNLPQPTILPLESLPPGYTFATRAYFRPEETAHRPLRLLSLDGGGVRGISSLHILKAVMDGIGPGARPCDHFDLIAGTSTGGLIAIMLGRLRMSVDDCIAQYHRLAKKIFKRNRIAQYGGLAAGEHRFNPTNLEEAIKSVVDQASPQNRKMADLSPEPTRTFVVAVKKRNVNNESPRRIRTYLTRNAPADTCEIWQAGRATSAAPSYFPPIELPDESGQPEMYIDGGLGYNNPSKELFYEAREVFGSNVPIGCFISIGTGRERDVRVGDIRNLRPAYKAFASIALSSERAHLEMEQYFSTSRQSDVYFRFNAGTRLIEEQKDEDYVGLEDWEKMKKHEAMTQRYLQEKTTARQIDKCVSRLQGRQK